MPPSLYIQNAILPSRLKDLVSVIPLNRPRRISKRAINRIPAYRQSPEHRQSVLWKLYRPLMRALPREYPQLKDMIRKRFRAAIRLSTSENRAKEEMQKGREVLEHCIATRNGNEASRECLEGLENARIERRRAAAQLEAEHKAKIKAKKERQDKLCKPQGSLLPPSVYNPPLHRFKPQPESLSMMIKKRVKARRGRIQRRSELLEEIGLMEEEAKITRGFDRARDISSSLSAKDRRESANEDFKGWTEPLQAYSRLMTEKFEKEDARSKMKFSPTVLKQAKRIRRNKVIWRTERKREREQEESRSTGEKG